VGVTAGVTTFACGRATARRVSSSAMLDVRVMQAA
jgi:hypothetical protein